MNITSSVDQLIGSLEAFKATMAKQQSADDSDSFELAFQAASEEITAITSQTDAVTSITNALVVDSSSAVAKTSFAEFQTQNLLMDTQRESRESMPSFPEFMDATGLDFNDASEFLYGVIGSNADFRDWNKIMASDNPLDATRAATRQLMNSDKEYAMVNHVDYGTVKFEETLAASSLSSKTVVSQMDNFAKVGANEATSQTWAVSSSGLMLRDAGTSQAQIERTAWLYGFDTEGLFA